MSAFKYSINIIICSLIILAIAGCDFLSSEKTIETDKQEQQEIINGLAATYWKGAKISIRSMDITSAPDNIDFDKIKQQQQQELDLGKHLSRIYDWQALLSDKEPDVKQLSMSELIELAKEVYDMKDKIKTMDEDDYPTMMEVIVNSQSSLNKPIMELPENWNSSMEHWLFAVVMETNLGFGSWKTYELSLTQIDDLKTVDFKVLAGIHKGINQLRNQWYFLADENFSAILKRLDGSITLTDEMSSMLESIQYEENTVEQQFEYQLKAFTYLLRGFTRRQIDDESLNNKAFNDIEQSITYFNKAGVDNELVWLAESYLYISLEEKDKAIASLNQLKASEYLTDNEKNLLQDSINSIEQRDSESALNFVSDKLIMYKLGLSYTMSYFNEVEWLKLLNKSDEGKVILDKFKQLEQQYQKAKQYLDIEELSKKGQNLLNS